MDMAAAAGKRKVRRWEEGKMNAPTRPSPEKEPIPAAGVGRDGLRGVQRSACRGAAEHGRWI
jgi:hypothetical protein